MADIYTWLCDFSLHLYLLNAICSSILDCCPGKDGPHLDAGRLTEFVVRNVATLGNYDYIFEVG